MSCWSWCAVIYLIGLPVLSWGQKLRLAPLPYKICPYEPLFVRETDSLRKRAILDSISILVPGRWQLVEAGAGACFTPPYAPDEYTEMILDSHGHGVVYQGDKLLTTFQLQLGFYWNGVRFLMDETRNPSFFQFFPSSLDKRAGRYYRPNNPYAHVYRNSLRVCEETLYMYGPRTGLSFVFKRLPAKYGPEP